MKNKNFGRKRQAIYILSNRKSTRIIKTLMDFFFFIKVKIKMVCFSVPSIKSKEVIQMDINSLAHTKWNCKYHIVFAPKYRRKVAYGKMKQDIAYTYGLRTPCKFKIQIWESPFLVQRILRRYCRENAKKIQEYIQNQLHWSIDLCILSL